MFCPQFLSRIRLVARLKDSVAIRDNKRPSTPLLPHPYPSAGPPFLAVFLPAAHNLHTNALICLIDAYLFGPRKQEKKKKIKTLNIVDGESFPKKREAKAKKEARQVNRRLIFGKRERVARIKIKSEGKHAFISPPHFHFSGCTCW